MDQVPDPLQPESPLVRALRSLQPRPIPIPRAVDEAILSAARARLRRRPRLLPWALRLGLPAAALLAVTLYLFRANATDVDGNGRLDIVDAYVLALRVEAGESLDPRFDFSGEGVVDRRDAEQLASLAVRLR
jgi:hypothetical protein